MTEPELKLLPSIATCEFVLGLHPSGKPHLCGRWAAMRLIGGKPLCDRHAEMMMESACGRTTKIRRTRL
jgi:hypothetical protein